MSLTAEPSGSYDSLEIPDDTDFFRVPSTIATGFGTLSPVDPSTVAYFCEKEKSGAAMGVQSRA
jgi:hypothetical protein